MFIEQPELPQLPFIFLGGNLAIDLVNTRRSRRIPGTKRIIQFDQLWDRTQAEAWWRLACARFDLARYEDCGWREAEFELLIALRAELRRLLESIIASWPRPETPVLNEILSRGSFVVTIGEAGPSREYKPRQAGGDGLMALALAASEFLADGELARLRACRSERCSLLFYDTTRSGTRHWCRQDCMNRSRGASQLPEGEGWGGPSFLTMPSGRSSPRSPRPS
jgi:predicted RNA-binding Zn ribbon-like protein